MPLVDITNDIKRSLKQNNQKNGVVVVANQKSHLLDKSPSHLKRISVAKTNEDDEEEQQPPTRARDSSRLSAGSGSSPFSKVSVEGPGEFLESEPSLSAKSDDLSNGNRRGSSGSEASVEQREERRTEEEEEEEEKQPVVVQQLRQSRRQKHQPQRLGDLLEWNDIKSNALYEKYDPEKEQRLLEQVQMEKEKLRRIEEEEKSKSSSSSSNNNNSSDSGRRASGGKKKLGAAVSTSAASSSSYQSGHQSQAVMEVHQRVADLMKMAEQMLPPEEEEEVDDGLPKKSIREKLRDAWDGDGYYAKLMKEQDGPSSSSSYSSSNGDSNNNNSSNAIKKTVSKANNNNGKKEGLKVYCDKENPVAHKVNRAKKAGGGLGGGGGLSSSSSKLAVGCGNNATTIGGLANSAPQPLVQRTALASALGNVTNNASSSSSSNNINNTISGTTYMFGNLKSIQAPSNLSSSSTHSLSSDRSTSTSPSSSSSASAASSAKETNETLLALKAENDLLRKQRNDVKLQHLKLKKELDDLKKNARIAVSKLCAKLPNNSRGVELDALAFLKLN